MNSQPKVYIFIQNVSNFDEKIKELTNPKLVLDPYGIYRLFQISEVAIQPNFSENHQKRWILQQNIRENF